MDYDIIFEIVNMVLDGSFTFEMYKIVKTLLNQIFINFNSYLYYLFKEKDNLEEKLHSF